MTKINRITLHGFKSFAHKIEIPLQDKFNCILGPNGSGKSNLGDAICFVLGRLSAKSMRVEKASNLIFNGGKNKKPSASATVEIAFSNQPQAFPLKDEEVIISRTITNNGTSIYKVNDKKMTRSEILDLLAAARINPEGYNIILQGDITRFVDQSGQERRKIIEEISEVSIYEDKKHKAMLELEKVEQKLNEATLILKERKTYLKELKSDRDQALKFKELKDGLDATKATLLHLQIQEKEEIKGRHDKELQKYQEKIKGSDAQVQQLKSQIEEHRKKIAAINEEIEHKGETQQLKVHKEIEDLKISLAQDKTRVSTLKDEIHKIQLRKEQFDVEIGELEHKAAASEDHKKELQAHISQKQAELAQLEQAILQFKKKHQLDSFADLDTEVEEKDKLIEQKQEEALHSRAQQQDLLREKDKLEYQIKSIDEKIQKVKEVEEQNKEQVKALQQTKSNFKSATLRLNQCLDQDSSFASQLANARKKLVDLQEKEAKLCAQERSREAHISASKALSSILEQKKKFKGVHGTVSELGQVSKKYSLSLSTAAGGRMQHLIVDDDKVAAECIQYLKENKLGQAAFIPLNKIRPVSISGDEKQLAKLPNVHGFALDLISYNPQYQHAFAFVFGNTLIVEDIDAARKVGIGKIKMATLDGNLAEASGVMRGGYIHAAQQSGFKEKDSLAELQKLHEEMDQLQKVLDHVEIKRSSNEQEIASLRTLKSELEAQIIKLERTLHLDSSDLEATSSLKKELATALQQTDQKLTELQRAITALNRDLADLKGQKQDLRSQVTELRNPRLLAQLTAFEQSKQSCKEELIKAQAELQGIAEQVAKLISPELEKIKDIIKQHDKEEKAFTEEIQRLSSGISESEVRLAVKEKASKEFYAKYHQLFAEREKISTQINRCDTDAEKIRDEMRLHEKDMNLQSLQNAEVKARLSALQEEFSRFAHVSLLKGKTAAELSADVAKSEVTLSQMSAVNMKALQIYEQVEKEYNNLVEKKDGLDKEKIEVLSFMNEIEAKKKDHFMTTFTKANENFQRIFSTLFKKGKAYLQLENPNNPFDDGLSVKVKLTGNRFMDIKSLSGGEKTLTALSFIFAIQEYQPATFYILDEIDAALDKHNSEVLAKLIRSYSDSAQYLMISHNDSIISEADVLFGVSMNEENVSKVTSLKI